MKKIFRVLGFFIAFFLLSCSSPVSHLGDETSDDDNDSSLSIVAKAGFIEIASHSYILDENSMESDKARIWYSFHPAESEPESKPIFVFFNGGPGAATALLFTYNTAPYTADQTIAAPAAIAKNPTSFTEMGSTIHIDARQTGFSYGMVSNPTSEKERSDYYRPDNFNAYVDAADFIRTILRLLQTMPELENNQIVLVGESYGGIRATAILNLLLYYNSDKYSGGDIYKDSELFSEIDTHFKKIFPEVSGEISAKVAARQFSHQILIQPLLTGYAQMDTSGRMMANSPTSAVAWVEAETGEVFQGCDGAEDCYDHRQVMNFIGDNGYDVYCYKRESNWLFDHTDVGIATLTDGTLFSTLIGANHTDIPFLSAKERKDVAFRFAGNEGVLLPLSLQSLPKSVEFVLQYKEAYRELHPLVIGDLESTLGTLPEWDSYFIDLNRQITQLFYQVKASPYDNRFGDRFLENLAFVKSFITNAEEDTVIYSPAIPEVLKEYTQVSKVSLSAARFEVQYSDETLGEITREVTFPYYGASCHSVPVTEPLRFYNDVNSWLFSD
ncbi:hypothetical protein KAH37_03775 [bacterium]|nr:hypothetical protein [bacterium]